MTTLDFHKNDRRLTLGVELELQVLDSESLLLTPRAHELLKKLNHPRIIKEFFQSTVELVTPVCENAQMAGEELRSLLWQVFDAGDELGLVFASTGTHPLAQYSERLITPTDRYEVLIERNQWLARRMAVYGLHVHIGVRDGDECVALSNFMLRHLSLFLALSASSPYWQKMDTGLASCRTTTYESLPTAAMPYPFETWAEFHSLYQMLIRSKSIQSMKDLWWDLRPSPGYGTLEIRICDGPASLAEMEAIVAFVHLLAAWYFEQPAEERSTLSKFPTWWIVRENKWRAIRHGLEASFITDEEGNTLRIRQVIEAWLERLQPLIRRMGYARQEKCIRQILAVGNSAQRQRETFVAEGSLEAVVQQNVKECMHIS